MLSAAVEGVGRLEVQHQQSAAVGAHPQQVVLGPEDIRYLGLRLGEGGHVAHQQRGLLHVLVLPDGARAAAYHLLVVARQALERRLQVVPVHLSALAALLVDLVEAVGRGDERAAAGHAAQLAEWRVGQLRQGALGVVGVEYLQVADGADGLVVGAYQGAGVEVADVVGVDAVAVGAAAVGVERVGGLPGRHLGALLAPADEAVGLGVVDVEAALEGGHQHFAVGIFADVAHIVPPDGGGVVDVEGVGGESVSVELADAVARANPQVAA